MDAAITEITREVQRGFIAEWTVTIILLLFATTTLVQAFVIPSASMEDTLLIGDHVLVDKLVYSPPGPFRSTCCRIATCAAATSSSSAIPLNIKEDYVKRAIGVPGDHIRLVEQAADAQRAPGERAVREAHLPVHRTLPRQFSRVRRPRRSCVRARVDMLQNHVVNGELVVPPGFIFAMGDNRDDSVDSRYWGLVPRENIVGTPLVIYWSFEAPTADLTNGEHRDRSYRRRGHALLHEDPLVADFSSGAWLPAEVEQAFCLLARAKLGAGPAFSGSQPP